jgi:two-component system response regulator HydG
VGLHTLPLPKESVMEAPTTPHLTILVVEDDADFAKALTTLLGRDGHTVETADNGRVALGQVHERRYDLILCDLRLPELDGQDVYHLLKVEAPGMHQRVIFLTGDTLNPLSIEFLEQHNLLWLPKPCTAAQVRDVIQQALRHAT